MVRKGEVKTMYTIKQQVFAKIMEKKFRSLVGNVCEYIELFAHKNGLTSDSEQVEELKNNVKKYSYDTMRDIEGQVEAFSKGVNVSVKFIRPDSE